MSNELTRKESPFPNWPQVWSRRFVYIGMCVVLSAVSSLPQVPPTKVSAETSTAAHQKGIRLLHEVEAQATSLPPEMRAFVLLQSAQGYRHAEPERQLSLLHDAFLATREIKPAARPDTSCPLPNDYCQTQVWLQTRILKELLQLDPREAAKLQPEASASVRQSLEGDLVAQYVRERDFERALDLLAQSSSEPRFPYWAAAELMNALPADHADQRTTAFRAAQANYLRFGASESFVTDRFLSLVADFGEKLPPTMVKQAITDLLEGAKAPSEATRFQVTLSGSEGVVMFTSDYEYRLFQLLPILKKLDPAMAQLKLKEHPEVQAALEQFPDGPKSLRSNDVDVVQLAQKESAQRSPGQAGIAAAEETEDQASSRTNKDPKGAFAKAMSLPEWSSAGPGSYSPRAEALKPVATAALHSDPDTARNAASELMKLAGQMNPADSGSTLVQVAGIYLALDESEKARGPLASAQKVAEVLYARDTDISDPNQVMKAFWPSTHLWWGLIRASAEISPQSAERVISSIPDAEIRALQRANLGSTLLGVPDGLEQALERHRDGRTRIAAY
jgi:hypothetical protein